MSSGLNTDRRLMEAEKQRIVAKVKIWKEKFDHKEKIKNEKEERRKHVQAR